MATIDLLTDTKQKIEEVVEYVNEKKRVAENLQKIVDIQNSIESGKVTKHIRSNTMNH